MVDRAWGSAVAVALMVLAGCDGGEVGGVDAGTTPGRDGEVAPPMDGEVDRDSGPPPAMGCGNGTMDPGEECDDGNTAPFDGCQPDCTLWEAAAGEPLVPDAPRTWQYFEIEGAQCRDGSPAGIAISVNPDSDGVLIFLEGGGACFNEQCERITTDTVYREPTGGIFDRGNAENPVADWSMVYVPYCTGDVFAGNNPGATVPGVREPQNFVGYANMGRFMQRLVPTFREASRVLLTGVSAGGFGAAANYQQVADVFGPVQVMLLDDSGPPMSSEVVAPCLQQQWREIWNLDDTILADCGADCPDPNDWILDFSVHLMQRYPDRPAGLFSNTEDFIIRGFYGYGRNDCMPGFFPNVPADEFRAGLEAFRATSEAEGGVFRTFYTPGTTHTCISGSCFYETLSGATMAGWVGELIAGTASHVGP